MSVGDCFIQWLVKKKERWPETWNAQLREQIFAKMAEA